MNVDIQSSKFIERRHKEIKEMIDRHEIQIHLLLEKNKSSNDIDYTIIDNLHKTNFQLREELALYSEILANMINND
jgi:hypothetical protein